MERRCLFTYPGIILVLYSPTTDNIGTDLCSYRARIGNFHTLALAKGRQLFFVNAHNILSFLTLINVKKYGIPLALAVFMFSHTSKSPPFYCSKTSQAHKETPVNISFKSCFSFFCKLLLLISGDIELNPGPINSSDTLSVIHVNARSLRNKIDLFEAECNDFDIVTVSETWLADRPTTDRDTDTTLSIHLTNFHAPVCLHRPDDPHGGVAIYVKNSLFLKPRPDLQVTGLEAVWVETKLNHESILIGSFYRPSGAKVEYWNLVNESIDKANNQFKKFLVLGDFNEDWFSNPSKHLLNILHVYNLHQLINTPTRITHATSTCIDLIITQTPGIVQKVDVLPAFCSDHSVPQVILKHANKSPSAFKRTIYSYEKLDIDTFCFKLQTLNWHFIFMEHDIDTSCKMFTEKYFGIAKDCMPYKTVTVRTRNAPWMTKEIQLSLKHRNRLHKKAKQTNNPIEWDNFRNFRNRVTNHIRTRKEEYYCDLNEQINNPQQFGSKDWWKLVNCFMKRKGIDQNEIPPIQIGDKTHYSNKSKADIFNDFFIQQATLENDNDPLPRIPYLTPEINNLELLIEDVLEVLKNLHGNKATGPDQIHNTLLRASADIIAKPLTMFFNRCLSEGKFPSLWKTAIVTPILKKGNKGECTNYRPISLLSCVGKTFERCVHKHIFHFLKQNDIITDSQSGFMPGDSTVNQLLCTYNYLCEQYDQSVTTQSIFFDISKAFDRVWHRGLISKLDSVGIRGTLLNWFTHYLKDRKQKVVIKGESSEERTVPSGVPQGSVLGPLLFIVYINDIVKDIQSNIKLFADDTSMSFSSNEANRLQHTLNIDLNTISEWSKNWKLTFNNTKTELLTIKRNQNPVLPLFFSQNILEEATHHKHLGITIQNNCKWDQHINNTAAKVKLLLNCLLSLKYKLNRKALETMYNSFILPILDYADIIWDNCTKQQADILENLHLEGLRTITGLVKGTSHAKLYTESGFCSLKERRERHKMIMFFKIIHGLTPQYLSNLLPPLISTVNPYHRRRPLDRIVPRFKTDIFRHSFFPSATDSWNKLPLTVQQNNSISHLKAFLRKNDSHPPTYYYKGNRKEQVIHCRLRQGMSNLNYDLYNRHLTPNPACACGGSPETAEHYLLYCQRHLEVRNETILTLPTACLSIKTLLSGNETLSINENELIFKTVQDYIKKTARF